MDSRRIKRWVGTRKARVLLVVTIPAVLFLVGRCGDARNPDVTIITATGFAASAEYVLLGLAMTAVLLACLLLVSVGLWTGIGLAWTLLTWVRTGGSSGYFDHDPLHGFRKRDDG
ncbi:hypothetical protein LCGC14_0925400 [marine sediment metagenome]|uniref:Uncharacterized protein n=1 Tax=marine sediment metagenome TaxID=412755 RepID=A0A0F9NUF8_9ZZZZ